MILLHYHTPKLTRELVAPYMGLNVDRSALNSVTRGLVGDTSFAVLPDVTPQTTFILTLGFQIVRLPSSYVYLLNTDDLRQFFFLDLLGQTVPAANMGHVHWCGYALRLRVVPIWLACAREGDSACHYPVQLVGFER